MSNPVARIIGLALIIYAAIFYYYEHRAGGSKNPHEWLSDHGQNFYPNSSRFSVIQMELRNDIKHTSECWDIDFCIRHGESRVRPCPK